VDGPEQMCWIVEIGRV